LGAPPDGLTHPANFSERRACELRRKTLPPTPVNRASVRQAWIGGIIFLSGKACAKGPPHILFDPRPVGRVSCHGRRHTPRGVPPPRLRSIVHAPLRGDGGRVIAR